MQLQSHGGVGGLEEECNQLQYHGGGVVLYISGLVSLEDSETTATTWPFVSSTEQPRRYHEIPLALTVNGPEHPPPAPLFLVCAPFKTWSVA